QIATLAVRTGARVVNFNTFSPWDDQVVAGTRTANNVPSYSEVRDRLVEALDVVAAAGTEVNVKYFPLCMLPERHRKSAYNFAQLEYDRQGWASASSAGVAAPARRLAEGNSVPPTDDLRPPPRPRLRLGALRRPLEGLAARSARLGRAWARLEHGLV